MIRALPVAPGIVSDDTSTVSEGRWIDGNRVRFVRGRVETIGGWVNRGAAPIPGVPRGATALRDISNRRIVVVGSHSHLIADREGVVGDITPVGLPVGNISGGVASGGYGIGTYGSGSFGVVGTGGTWARMWSLSRWANGVVAVPRGGPLCLWAGDPAVRATTVANAPDFSDSMIVTPEGFVVLLGTKSVVGGLYNPLLIRWSSIDDVNSWTPTVSNTTGELPVRDGGRIVGGLPTRRQSLIWTETTCEALTFTGDASVFLVNRVATNAGLISQNAAAVAAEGGAVWWMTPDYRILRYTGGAPEDVQCTVQTVLQTFCDPAHREKIHAFTVGDEGEVWWCYPDTRDGTGEPTRYIAVNPRGEWTLGRLDRTCWLDRGVLPFPVGWAANGLSYDHERGQTADGAPLAPWIESGAFDLDDGGVMVDLDAMIPDIGQQIGVVNATLYTRDGPRNTERVTGPLGINAGTTRVPFEARGRQIRQRFDGVGAPCRFRLGESRFEIFQRADVQ